MTRSCCMYFPSPLLELRRDRWISYRQEQSTPGICSKGLHLKKWHDGSTSRGMSNDSSDGIAAITNKLDSLGRDMKKLKENVHVIKIGCKNYGGAHLNKECPLNKEVKSVNEVKAPIGEVKERAIRTKIGECKAIYTKEGLPLYRPFYYSLEKIKYFSSNSRFSDDEVQEETEEVEEIKEVAAQLETTHQKVTPNLPQLVSYYVAPYGKLIPFPIRLKQHAKEGLIHKDMESLKRIKINHPLLKEIRQNDDYTKHMKNLMENKQRTLEKKMSR
ncbi:hypothetical protein Tco_1077687 [Tanacetum coccineum]